jgi:transcriptional regulator with XRE-family HTH domain
MGKQAKDLRALRLEKRLTQEQVAAKLKVSQSYYSQVERGAKLHEITPALHAVSRMRTRTDRTAGGDKKAGRIKGR